MLLLTTKGSLTQEEHWGILCSLVEYVQLADLFYILLAIKVHDHDLLGDEVILGRLNQSV